MRPRPWANAAARYVTRQHTDGWSDLTDAARLQRWVEGLTAFAGIRTIDGDVSAARDWMRAHGFDIGADVLALVEAAGAPCKPGERSDLTGCTPASGQAPPIMEETDAAIADRVAATLAAKRQAPPKPTSPGMQLAPEVRAAMVQHGVRLPPMHATNIKIDAAAVNDPHAMTAVVTWEQVSTKSGRHSTVRGYTKYSEEIHARAKWNRARALSPVIHATRDALAAAVAANPADSDALAAAIIAETGLRPGGDKVSTQSGAYGVTTMRPEHVRIASDGRSAEVKYIGKESVENTATITRPELVDALRTRLASAQSGAPLVGGNPARALKQVGWGGKVKDLRTVKANELASFAIAAHQAPPPPAKNKRQVADAVKAVVGAVGRPGGLNNKPSQARKSYILPEVLNDFQRYLES